MGIRKALLFRKRYHLLRSFLIFLLILLAYQNCSKIALTPVTQEAHSVAHNNSGGQLPLPKNLSPNSRVVILVDQSFSMVWDKCPEDLDGATPAPSSGALSCDRAPGVDTNQYRYQIIRKWLDELDQYASQGANIKVMILPFSGGKAIRPKPSNAPSPIHGLRDFDYMKFLSINNARTWVQALQNEQTAVENDPSIEIMGTTIFKPILDYAQGKIQAEVDILKNVGELESTPFEVIWITDGVYKPTNYLFSLLHQVSGCPDCTQNPDHQACSWGQWSGPVNPYQYCQMLEQNFRQYIGVPEVNVLDQVIASVNNIFKLKQQPAYSGLRLRIRLAKMNWQAVPIEDKNTASDKTKNIFDEIQEKTLEKLNVYNIDSAEPPFSVFSGGTDSLTYIIKNLYAINTNAYVDKYGKLTIDSDGDGLPDNLDPNPQNPRSNGFCLDGISKNFGCTMIGCDPKVDRDHDGLNECEEATIKTASLFFDSDKDNIPDLFEALRGLNPNFNDSKTFSSGDRYSDHRHFYEGVSPQIKLADVANLNKVRLETKLIGFDTVKDENNTTHAVGHYIIDLKNLPLVPTLAVPASKIPDMKPSQSPTALPIPHLERLDTTPKLANENQIIFLLQMTTVENPDKSVWFILKSNYKYLGYSGSMSLGQDFKFTNFKQIQGSL